MLAPPVSTIAAPSAAVRLTVGVLMKRNGDLVDEAVVVVPVSVVVPLTALIALVPVENSMPHSAAF